MNVLALFFNRSKQEPAMGESDIAVTGIANLKAQIADLQTQLDAAIKRHADYVNAVTGALGDLPTTTTANQQLALQNAAVTDGAQG